MIVAYVWRINSLDTVCVCVCMKYEVWWDPELEDGVGHIFVSEHDPESKSMVAESEL